MLPKFEFSSSDFQNCLAYQQFCLLGEVIMKIENIKFYHIREKFYHVKPTRSRRRSGRSWTGCTSASCTTSTRRKSLLCSVPRAHPDVNNATLSFALFVGTQNWAIFERRVWVNTQGDIYTTSHTKLTITWKTLHPANSYMKNFTWKFAMKEPWLCTKL